MDQSARERLGRAAALVLLFAFALAVRWHFVAVTQPESPVSGDERSYAFYALNLVRHGVFSMAPPGAQAPAPDGFRGPGYPVLVAASMWVSGLEDIAWYAVLQRWQAVLGGLCAVMVVLLGRFWLPWRSAFVAGVAAALWPHAIGMTAYVLPETLYCTLLLAALLTVASSLRTGGALRTALAGLVFAALVLTNPVALPILLVVSALLWSRHGVRAALVFVLVAVVGSQWWSVRDTDAGAGQTATDRAIVTFVQGSWPQFHSSWLQARTNADPQALALEQSIDGQARLMATEPWLAVGQIAARAMHEPWRYTRWYLVEKPFLLWDWSIQIGQGDLEVGKLAYSPFIAEGPFRVLAAIARALNPWLFAAMAGVLLALLFRRSRDVLAAADALPHLLLVAGTIAVVSAVHVALFAEPRYSIALRPLQLLLVATAATTLIEAWRRRNEVSRTA